MKHVHFTLIMYNHALLGLIIAAIWIFIQSIIDGYIPLFYTATQFGLIVAACIFDIIGLNSMTIAYQVDKAAFVSLVGQLNIVYAFLADYFIFDETPS